MNKQTIELFGDFIEHFPPEQDALELRFTPSSHPIRKRWRTHRLSAHFMADYFTNFLPIDEDDPSSERRIKESKGAVSYVANELLENAMKFNDETSHYKVRFGIQFLGDVEVTAAIFATNSIKFHTVEPFKAFIQELLTGDPAQLYIQQIEKSAEAETETSGLGLLTMINDYAAKLGWRFEAIANTIQDNQSNHSPDVDTLSQAIAPTVIVTTMAQISV